MFLTIDGWIDYWVKKGPFFKRLFTFIKEKLHIILGFIYIVIYSLTAFYFWNPQSIQYWMLLLGGLAVIISFARKKKDS